MNEETKFRPTFKFCAELYRSADFFLLHPLLPVVQHRLGDYCDEKIKWMFTRWNVVDDRKSGRKALVWVEDLKDAIVEVEQWRTPVIRQLLMEFIWAGKRYLENYYPVFHTSIGDWLFDNFRGFYEEMYDRCNPDPPQFFGPRRIFHPAVDPAVWTPKRCQTPIPNDRGNTCVRCGRGIVKDDGVKKEDRGQLRDPFNVPSSWQPTREWCQECAASVKYPWREEGYL